jgi:IS30 family transposase
LQTLVEHKIRFFLPLYLTDAHTADAVEAERIIAIQWMPELSRKSATWDQGREMAHHAAIT